MGMSECDICHGYEYLDEYLLSRYERIKKVRVCLDCVNKLIAEKMRNDK